MKLNDVTLLFLFRFVWDRTNVLLGHSTLEVRWQIPNNTESGTYRIRHFGTSRNVLGSLSEYTGTSSVFTVLNGGRRPHKYLRKIVQ